MLIGVAVLLLLLAGGGCAHNTTAHENIVYSTAGPRDQQLTIFTPRAEAEAARPCVLLVHGGAWIFGSRHQLRWYGRRLAEAGYVTAAMSYRKLPRHNFLDSVHDAKAAVRWLRLHADVYDIDPARIAALGNSAGGYLVGMLAATGDEPAFAGDQNHGPSDAIRAAVVLYGALDLSVYRDPESWIRVGGLARRIVKRYVRDGFDVGGDAFAAASPINYLGPDTAPMLLLTGTHDSLVPFEVARDAYTRLYTHGVPVRWVQFRGRGHAFDYFYPRLRHDVLGYVLQFLDTHLVGGESAAGMAGGETSHG
ncbi:MAG: alpha/beta hydrolase [Candidatus Hydrogenedentota bacterium]